MSWSGLFGAGLEGAIIGGAFGAHPYAGIVALGALQVGSDKDLWKFGLAASALGEGGGAAPPAEQCPSSTAGADALKKAGQALDRGGLTKAGRALEKHGSRPGSVFPKATGNVAAKNAQGQAMLNDILGTVSRTSANKYGGLDYWGGGRGGGARFDAQGNFIGFLEP